ncbi:MAG: Gfo/Idh/MocA family oxidoreductase, partial [Pseudomonadota bacterium]
TARLWQQDEPRSWWRPLSDTRYEAGSADPLDEQIRHFCSVIDGAEAPLVSGEEGVRTLRVIEAIKRSASTGRRESV